MTLWIIAAIAAAVGAVVLLSKKKRAAEPTPAPGGLHIATSPDPLLEAGIWAANYWNGRSEVTTIGATGSMLPLLKGGEVAVLAHDFSGIAIGSIVAYRTVGGSSPAIGSRLIHRIVGGNATDGWIPKGDTPGCFDEDWNPITRQNYIGTLVAIFRQV